MRPLILLLAGLSFGVVGAEGVEFAGSWESLLAFDFEESAWEMEGELTVAYAGMGWDVEGVIEFDLQEWRKLEVEASLELLGIELGSKLTMDPSEGRLKKLATEASFEAHELDFDVDLDLYPNHCWTDLRAQYELDEYEIDIETRLGSSKTFSLDFYRTDIEVSFATCGIPVDIEARFSAKKGFERIDVETLFPLPSLPRWLAIEVEARLTLTGTQLSFEPEFDALVAWEGLSASIELFGEVVAPPGVLGLDGMTVVGTVFSSSWDNGWMESRTSFGPAWNKKITKHKEYGRAVGIGYEADDSCDREVSFEAWIYYIEPSGLFEWDRRVLVLAVQPEASWEFALTACFEPGSIAEIALGLDIEW